MRSDVKVSVFFLASTMVQYYQKSICSIILRMIRITVKIRTTGTLQIKARNLFCISYKATIPWHTVDSGSKVQFPMCQSLTPDTRWSKCISFLYLACSVHGWAPPGNQEQIKGAESVPSPQGSVDESVCPAVSAWRSSSPGFPGALWPWLL